MRLRYLPKLSMSELLLTLLTVIIVFLNAATPLIDGIVSYGTYLALLILFLFIFIKGKIFVRKDWGIIIALLLISGIIASIRGEEIIGGVLSDIHRHLFFTASMLLVFCVRWDKYISKNFVSLFLKAIVFSGVIASLYAFVMQGNLILKIITTNSRVYYEAYKSFFTQRNVYAAFLFFCSIATIYLHGFYKQKKYLVYLIIFVFQIYLASSKASLAGVLIFIALYLYLVTKKKIFFILIALIITAPIVGKIVMPMFSGMAHSSLEGVTSSEVRFSDWSLGLKQLKKESALITGLGMGSEATFLLRYRKYGSFHNVYMDLLFQGGLIKLGIYFWAMLEILKNIWKSSSVVFKNTFIAALASYAAYSMFESGAMLFSNSFFSFLTTVMFGILPQCNFGKDTRNGGII